MTNDDKLFVEAVSKWRNTTPESKRITELEQALKSIVEFGYGLGHSRGFSCAKMAEKALSSHAKVS